MKRQVLIAFTVTGILWSISMPVAADVMHSAMHHSDVSVNYTDRHFVELASKGGAAEIALSRVALRRSDNPKIVKFASMMINDHQAMGAALGLTARDLGLHPSNAMDMRHTKLHRRLMRLHGSALNSAYLAAMVADHGATASLFQNEIAHGKNIHLTNFATKNVATVQNHLQMALDMTSSKQMIDRVIKNPRM